MKKGKWNYSQDIEYTVILVKIKGDKTQAMNWQNAFVGDERQAVKIQYETQGVKKFFYIDNYDGTGLLKIDRLGGPDSYSAHLGEFELIRELPEIEWQKFDQSKYDLSHLIVQKYQQQANPEEYEKIKKLREMIQSKNYHIDRKGTMQPGKK